MTTLPAHITAQLEAIFLDACRDPEYRRVFLAAMSDQGRVRRTSAGASGRSITGTVGAVTSQGFGPLLSPRDHGSPEGGAQMGVTLEGGQS